LPIALESLDFDGKVSLFWGVSINRVSPRNLAGDKSGGVKTQRIAQGNMVSLTPAKPQALMIPTDTLLNAFATYFVTIDPPGQAAIFIGLTAGMTAAQSRRIALRGTVLGTGILIAFAFIGSSLLALLGITMPAFRVAGGLLLFYIAAEMVFEKRAERREETAEKAVSDHQAQGLAIFPIAVPLIAGPGAISAAILQSTQLSTPLQQAAHVGVIVAVGLILYIFLLVANKMQKFVSESVSSVLTRLLGILLAALSVQFIADGIKALMA